jgi:hypothetical protein
MERIISDTSEIPKLTKTNYHECALEVQANMEGRSSGMLWRPTKLSAAQIDGC